MISPLSRVFWPYYLGSDNPIPHLFEQLAMRTEDYAATVFSLRKERVVENDKVEEIYAHQPNSARRWVNILFACLDPHDLIHTGGHPTVHSKIVTAAKIRNPMIKHIHTFRVDVDPSSNFSTEYRQILAENADLTTAVSKHTAKTVEDHFGIKPNVIYNGVDSRVFTPEVDQPDLYDDIHKPIFIFVGNIEERKRPYDVLEVAKKYANAEFILIGDGPLSEDIKSKSQKFDNVTMTGRIAKESLPGIYAHATALFFPSVQEGCPNVVLESMASETPVVAYATSSMPELIDNGNTGYLHKTGDVDSTVDSLKKIAKEPNNMGEKAREYVINNHDFDDIASQYFHNYKIALGE